MMTESELTPWQFHSTLLEWSAQIENPDTAALVLGRAHFPILQQLISEYMRLLRVESRVKEQRRKAGQSTSKKKADAARKNAAKPRPGRRKTT